MTAVAKNGGVAPPGYYDKEYSQRDWTAYSALLAKLLQHSQPGAILDIGAGCGYFVEAAIRWGLDCVGVEGSPEGIAIGKRRFEGIKIWEHRLSEPLPFADASFQSVLLNQVIEHLEPTTARQVLHESLRVLKPGGLILITSPSKANRFEARADPTHINLITPTQLRESLVEAGFCRVIPFDSSLPIFGRSRLMRGLTHLLFRLCPVDFLSATSNAMAYKPFDDKSYWEWRATTYGKRAVLNLSHSEREFDAVTRKQKDILLPIFIAQLDGNERTALDFGCGPGRFTRDIAEAIGGTAVGLDISRELISIAPRSKHVQFHVVDDIEFPSPHFIFDVVWICLVLGGVRQIAHTVDSIERALKAGGLLFLVENTQEKADSEHWAYRSVIEYQRMFTSIDLKPVFVYRDVGEEITVFAGRKRK